MKNTVSLVVASFLLLSASAPSASARPLQGLQLPAGPATSNSPLLGFPTRVWKACSLGWNANDDFVSLAKNTSKTFSPLWNDDDTPQQNFGGILSGPQNGTAEVVGLDAIKYTPNPGYTGSDSIFYSHIGCLQCADSGWSAWCSEPSSDTATIYITVTN